VQSERLPSRNVFGLLLLDKPAGLSSNRALQRVKRLFAASKAGHAGSLDPLATGMLPIFFGSATRLAAYMLEARKCYRVTATLGIATTTGDAEGATTEDRSGYPAAAPAVMEDAVASFIGEIEQIPPMYSALKRDGVPLYRLARAGIEVARQPRRVVIEELTIDRYEWPELTLTVRCSKGTYVRTLVEDIAKAAGTVGHVAALRRLAVDPFDELGMHSLDGLERALDHWLLPPETALQGWASAHVPSADAARLMQGQSVPGEPGLPLGQVKVYAESGPFIAIATVTSDGRLAPERVFIR
jgi:tRNA pseudouridine55 synthase